MAIQTIEYYIDRYTAGTITTSEWLELRQLLDDPEQAHSFDELIDFQLLQYKGEQENQTFAAVSDRVVTAVEAAMHAGQPRVVKRLPVLRKWWWAAASIILLLGIGFYFWLNSIEGERNISGIQPSQIDIQPGKVGAILTLNNGRHIVLDSLGNGLVATQNGSQVNLQNGRLTYDLTEKSSGEIAYNVMTTPRGRQFELQLPDGTKVWLNAASSLRYPTEFSGMERRVEITGEAYFEVAKNTQLPFRVSINNNTEIEVTGTQFNVNAYKNETSINTTLLEGAVRIKTAQERIVLKPSQQAQVAGDSITVVPANEQQVVAWKNGYFHFKGVTLPVVMRQLERWYDIEVRYEGVIPSVRFQGKLTRDLTLHQLLRVLEKVDVHFRLEGKTLIIQQ